jgi:hypothetical protein
MSEEKKKNEVEYNKIALELIASLAGINQSVVFEKVEGDEEKITVKGADSNKSIAYIFEAPKQAFDFNGEDCSFFNFNEFFNLFNLFENPNLEQDETNIKINEGSSELEYRLTDRELIKKTFNRVKFEDPDVDFILDSELLKKMKNLAGKANINAEYIKFEVVGETLTYTLYNEKHHNTYKESLPVENPNDVEFSIENITRVFTKIPPASYRVAMKEEGLIRFSMIREDDISVVIYTADAED